MQRRKLSEYPKDYSRPRLFSGTRNTASVDINFKLCQSLLKSWLNSLSDSSRRWDRSLGDDMLLRAENFNTFGMTIPNTNTRATLKDGVFSIFDCDIIGKTHSRAEQLRLETASYSLASMPSNVPMATNPAIAKELYNKIKELAASNPNLSVEVDCDEPSGFSFTVTGDLELLANIYASANRSESMNSLADEQSSANTTIGYTLVFRQPRTLVKGVDYTADESGHVSFQPKTYSSNNRY